MEIHIGLIHIFARNAELGQRKAVSQDWKAPKTAGEKNSVQRAALALRRVQENLILQRGGLSSIIGKSSSKKKKKTLPALNLKGNRIVNISHLGKFLQSVTDHASICLCDENPRMEQEIEWKNLGCVSNSGAVVAV